MWKHFARIIGDVRPRFVFVENSPILTSRGLGRVLRDLAAMGYDAEYGVLSAADVGANHRRERIWILAHSTELQRNGGNDHAGISMERQAFSEFGNDGRAINVAHANSDGLSNGSDDGRRYCLSGQKRNATAKDRKRLGINGACATGSVLADTDGAIGDGKAQNVCYTASSRL